MERPEASPAFGFLLFWTKNFRHLRIMVLMTVPCTSDEWRVLRGQDFSPADAREASDFAEVIANTGLEPDEAYEMFKVDGDLTVGKRLFFAESISLEKATLMLILDPDEKIRGVIDHRLKEAREKENGGIIITG